MDRHQAELISHLAEHPAWKALEKLAETKREAKLKQLATKIAAGELDPKDVGDIRGFLRGMDAVLKAPRNALKELD